LMTSHCPSQLCSRHLGILPEPIVQCKPCATLDG
jgi:hypothetical protein